MILSYYTLIVSALYFIVQMVYKPYFIIHAHNISFTTSSLSSVINSHVSALFGIVFARIMDAREQKRVYFFSSASALKVSRKNELVFSVCFYDLSELFFSLFLSFFFTLRQGDSVVLAFDFFPYFEFFIKRM